MKRLRNDIVSTTYAIKEILEALKHTQAKLIPGEGITINEHNVISASGGEGGVGVEYHTKQWYQNHPSSIFPQGTLIIYSDLKTDEQGRNVPGIKISDGLTYAVDLPFITEEEEKVIEDLATSIDMLTQVIEEKETFWDSKINCEDEVVNGTLIINRN